MSGQSQGHHYIILGGKKQEGLTMIRFWARLLSAALFFAVIILRPSPVYSSNKTIYNHCVDSDGNKVKPMFSTSVHQVALATKLAGQAGVVVYNPYEMRNINPRTRLFFFTHECAHYHLGHPIMQVNDPLTDRQERQADCWAIKTLVRENLIDYNELSLIKSDLDGFGKDEWEHLPGPFRPVDLNRCLGR
ncbi:MAG: hypothetical protein ACE5GM_00350 [bacterium]